MSDSDSQFASDSNTDSAPTRTKTPDLLYAVRKGRNVKYCIFLRWQDCQAQLEGCLNAEYKAFAEWDEAFEYVKPREDWGASLPTVSRESPAKKKRKVDRDSTSTGVVTAAKKTGTADNLIKKLERYSKPKPGKNRPLHIILVEGYQQCRPKGWRCRELGLSFREPRKQVTQNRYLQDLAELKGTLALGRAVATEISAYEKINILAQSDHEVLSPFSIRYLNHSWGVNRKYHNDLGPPSTDVLLASVTAKSPFSSCTIECRQAARMRFTPKKLYINHRVEELTNESKMDNLFQPAAVAGGEGTTGTTSTGGGAGRDQKRLWQQQAVQEWETIVLEDEAQREYWDERAKEHDRLHPTIEPKLISILQKDPQRSAAKLVDDIGYWCGRTTISKWRLRWEQRKRKRGTRKDSPNNGKGIATNTTSPQVEEEEDETPNIAFAEDNDEELEEAEEEAMTTTEGEENRSDDAVDDEGMPHMT